MEQSFSRSVNASIHITEDSLRSIAREMEAFCGNPPSFNFRFEDDFELTDENLDSLLDTSRVRLEILESVRVVARSRPPNDSGSYASFNASFSRTGGGHTILTVSSKAKDVTQLKEFLLREVRASTTPYDFVYRRSLLIEMGLAGAIAAAFTTYLLQTLIPETQSNLLKSEAANIGLSAFICSFLLSGAVIFTSGRFKRFVFPPFSVGRGKGKELYDARKRLRVWFYGGLGALILGTVVKAALGAAG